MIKKGTVLFYNAKIYTLKEEGELFEAMLVKKGRIAKLYKKLPKKQMY